jgi:hypothetical protein
VRGEKIAREIHVFGRDAHLAVVLEAERRRHIVEIRHAAHVDPGLRHRHDHVGMAEAQIVDEDDVPVGFRDQLAHEIFPGQPEMHGALRERLDDLGSGEIGNPDGGEVRDAAAILASAPRLDEVEAGAREERFRVLLQASFGWYGNDEGLAHAFSPCSPANRSIQTAKPTAGIALALPRRVSSPS